jgi:predicted N-acetyltransferase YhbS
MLYILIKSQGQFKHSGKYYLLNGRWHKLHADKPAPKNAPISAHPHAAGQYAPAQHLTDEQWKQLELPDTNTNAGPHNAKVKQIKELANSGNVTGLLGMSIGSNTYGKHQANLVNHILEKYGSPHKVAAGQKAGEHVAVQVEPIEDAKQAAIDHLETDSKQDNLPASEKQEDMVEVAKLKREPATEAVTDAKEHLETDIKQADIPAAEKKQDAALVQKLDAAKTKTKHKAEKVSSATAEYLLSQIKDGKNTSAINEIQSALMSEYKNKYVIKDEGGKVVAAAAFGINPNTAAKSVEIHHIGSTIPGGGSALVGEAIKFAQKNGANVAMFSHPEAIAFYEKLGFKQVPGKPDGSMEYGVEKKQPRLILPVKTSVAPHPLLDKINWDSHKVAESNTNANSHNPAVDKIKKMVYAGDLAGLEAFYAKKAGAKQTYAVKQAKLARVAIAALNESSPNLAKIDAAAHEAATSPHNGEVAPSQAQIEAGNYKKGHISVHGLDITIENPRGSVRSGKRPDGSEWSHKMSDHYGYIKRTTGADGEQVDVYVGQHPESEKVFVVDQVDQSGGFDEHKVMLGFHDKDAAIAAYRSNFDDNWKVGPVTEMSVDEFKDWLKGGDTGKPVADIGPHEGDVNAEGLVFRNGRWHRDDDGLSDDPNSANYRFKDTGYIAGSRKELAAETIRQAAKAGVMLRSTGIDWDEIEKNPREARELIKKSNLFGKVDWSGLREQGMDPGAGFLIDRVYASVAAEPDRDSPQKRKDYALGLESLRDRMERCKTPSEVVDVLGEIRDELEGSMLTEEQSLAYSALMDNYHQLREKAREAKAVKDAVYQDWNRAQNELNSAKYEQEKRIRRRWKPDPELAKKIITLHDEVVLAEKKFRAYQEDHPELQTKKRDLPGGGFTYEDDLEWDAYQFYHKAQNMMKAVRAENLMNNPVTRAWITLGPKFLAVLNYRRSSGSDAFAGHVTNARRGKITDWSWAEKEGVTVKRATKREVAFQLKVADNYERKGGREVKAASTAEFKNLFGLRDVQSGNWVLNDPNSAAWHIQQSTEALADLADLLGAPDDQVSMHGRLALAFGARGRGNAGGIAARAHYESVHRVINLTKMGGGGCLGHEWAHALDNLCVEAETGNAGAKDYASENPELLPDGELRNAFVNLRSAMLDGDIKGTEKISYTKRDIDVADFNLNRQYMGGVAEKVKRAGSAQAAIEAVDDYYGNFNQLSTKQKKQANDWRKVAVAYYDRNPEGGVFNAKSGPSMSSFAYEASLLDDNTPYWSQTKEMFARAFQSYCEDKLASQGRKNDYLSAMADNKHYIDRLLGIHLKPFPEGDERARINAAFDKLIEALQKSGTLAKAATMLKFA